MPEHLRSERQTQNRVNEWHKSLLHAMAHLIESTHSDRFFALLDEHYGSIRFVVGTRSGCCGLPSLQVEGSTNLPPLQGEGWGGDGVKMKGQTSLVIIGRHIQQKLRNNMT
ncbi:MAG: hypothetical protein Q8O79_09790, partial [Pseudomonadota bacterium]|nr:hypothetical protein [Pseudomonadota bacterium]